MSAPIEIFLSYTHDSVAHKVAVAGLANDLRGNGIDARLDQEINGTPPEGWPGWMERRIASASFVLVVCTEQYKRRYDNNEMPGVGLGAQWEGGIIRQELYESPGKNIKFAAILFDASAAEFRPTPLRAHTHYVYPRDREALLRWLTDQPAYVPAPLGPKPSLPPNP